MAKCKGRTAKGHVKKGYRVVKGKPCPVKMARKTKKRAAKKRTAAKRRTVKRATKKCRGKVSVKAHKRSCPR